MLAFLSAHGNVPFSIALVIVIMLGTFELIAMIAGLSIFSALDNSLSVDTDVDMDAETSITGMTGLLGWLCLDRLPLLIWLVLILSSFAIAGYVINFTSLQISAALLPQLITVPIAFIITLISSHFLGNAVANILPKNETSAISVDSLVGCVATITQGRAVKGMPTEAVARDEFQQKHYVLVEPERLGIEFVRGAEVVLLARKGKVWTAAQI
ncbi:YqiJ family protein [Shewanella sp. SR43-4]|uniref:YqiJ family protein n=1 Tax=Shewanella sp. SR43-4 TaxID=2760942 RepID=UPI0015F9A87E|nr:YqiJ family protein [Shewanella sp. SR43-4]MBB1316366.1 YqiJ family protein [Shewanella sp. SR43-4]